MLKVKDSGQFKKDYKRCVKRGLNILLGNFLSHKEPPLTGTGVPLSADVPSLVVLLVPVAVGLGPDGQVSVL